MINGNPSTQETAHLSQLINAILILSYLNLRNLMIPIVKSEIVSEVQLD